MSLPELSVRRAGEALQVAPSKGFLSVHGEALAFGNLASVAFGGPDLRTLHLGSLAGTRLATLRVPVAGARPHHWMARPAF